MKRCAFLLPLFFFALANAQIYVSDGAVIKGGENIYSAAQSEAGKPETIEVLNRAIVFEQQDAAKTTNADHHKKSLTKQIRKARKPLESRKERIDEKIKNIISSIGKKKADYHLSPDGQNSPNFFSKTKNSKVLISSEQFSKNFANQHNSYWSVYISGNFSSKIRGFSLPPYQSSEDFLYSVRPPPSF